MRGKQIDRFYFLQRALAIDVKQPAGVKTLIAAKLIMMLGLSLFGKTLSISFTRPVYLILAVAILAALYLISAHFRKKHGL